MPDFKPIFASWQQLAGAEGDPWESEDDMMFLLDFLPPSGDGLETICAGHPHGQEVLARLQQFYRDAAVENGEEGSEFHQRRVTAKSDDEIRELLLSHAAAIREMAMLCSEDPDNDDLVQCAGNPPRLVHVESADEIEGNQDIEILFAADLPSLFDEKVARARAGENPLSCLTEALYHSAWNDYAVANYVQWPLARGQSTIDDPYRPGYELWTQGVRFTYTDDGVIHYTIESD